jgi:hypothetical protein
VDNFVDNLWITLVILLIDMIVMLLLIDMIALIELTEMLHRGGGGDEHWRNIGVGSKAHKKVNRGKQSTPVPKVRKKSKSDTKK